MARRLPNYGRVLTNQLSVLIGLPLSFLLLKGLPAGGSSSVGLYGAVFFVMGATVRSDPGGGAIDRLIA